jgi:hypothetical protein
MKNSLIILLLLLLSTTIGATNYYIDPSGSDSNSGSSSSPWKTLSYACSKATTSGDIIHVNAGTYTETVQSALAVGVSIEGVGVTSIIKSHVGGSNWTIQLYSGTQGTNGNQHISNIKMDGDNLTSYAPIGIFDRSNVEIYNCTFINFYSRGINFQARADPGEPTIWATGNAFHDNTVTNCSSCTPSDNGDGTTGALMIAGQQTMLIYNNTLDQTERTSGSTGFLIKGVGGYNKDIKIYNNTILKTTFGGTVWDFAIEMWNCLGGIEIYNNTMTGSIDFSGTYGVAKGVYSYGAWIHNNIIGEATVSNQNAKLTRGVQFEQQAEGIIVEKNWFKNMGTAVYFPVYHESPFTFSTYKDITIRYNIFNNLGSADGLSRSGYGIYFNTATGGINVCNGFYVYNNVFIGHVGTTLTGWGIEIPDNFATISNVSIRNNIVENFDDEPAYGSTAVSGLSIENNIFYNNGHNNIPVYSGSGTVQKNLTGNPLFISSTDFHLQASSPAIGKGQSITGLTTDYDGNTLNDPPSIGAYEGSAAVVHSSVVQNKPPIVNILNPLKGNAYENLSSVEIDAIASDPDGSISKVEFYCNSAKLVELTSTPYTYTWKGVQAGSYSIRAVAIDNLNDSTVSAAIEFEVAGDIKYGTNSNIIKLYPNPNNGHFSIEFIKPLQNDKSEMVITDLAGNQVYNSPVLKEEAIKQIDIYNYKSGIYVMMIKDKELLVTKKFIIN